MARIFRLMETPGWILQEKFLISSHPTINTTGTLYFFESNESMLRLTRHETNNFLLKQ